MEKSEHLELPKQLESEEGEVLGKTEGVASKYTFHSAQILKWSLAVHEQEQSQPREGKKRRTKAAKTKQNTHNAETDLEFKSCQIRGVWQATQSLINSPLNSVKGHILRIKTISQD